MRTSARILISLAVVIVVLGALNLWTEWGQKDFSVDADAVGAWAFLAVSCLVVGVVLNALSKAGEPPVEVAAETPYDDETGGPGTPLCPSCLAPAEPRQHFCSECGAPLTSHAEIDPLGRIYSMGDTFRKAAASPRRRIVLIGMWCIFAIPMILFVFVLEAVVFQTVDGRVVNDDGLVVWNETRRCLAPLTLGRVLYITSILGIALLYGAIVIKTTRNFFRKQKEPGTDAADAKITENTEADE
ncbi:MAG: hypothetical protein ISS69_09520 [Phycisphaerae bacterium]|nr:hypothetical protein [Phycisphaerae bacterium]